MGNARVRPLEAASVTPPMAAEWLEPDGHGGFASGTVLGTRRRRYHALLNVALTPPTGRTVLVSGFDAWIDRVPGPSQSEWLTVQRYAPDVTAGREDRVVAFTVDPWPTWTYRLADGTEIEHELLVAHGSGIVALRWRLVTPAPNLRLNLRPFLAPRDLHALHRENADFRFDATVTAEQVRWKPYGALPGVVSTHNGSYHHEPVWYRRFQLDEERARGFDYLEDAGSPGVLTWDLSGGEAVWVVGAEGAAIDPGPVTLVAERIRRRERLRRGRLGDRLARAADAYVVARGTGKTIIAGYPWFTDWGRDTFIALRGLCFETGRLEDARSILTQWAATVSDGMLPNRFVDQGDAPEFNSVDASLWYVVVAAAFLDRMKTLGRRVAVKDRRAIQDAVQAILEGYSRGTRYRIQADGDGLLMAGVPGVQLTWMDAKLGDWVVTPRIGKPVEVQALWINALLAGGSVDPEWRRLAARAMSSFPERFWNPGADCLYDVVDVDGQSGTVDDSIRPNQIFAVGGLPNPLLDGERARRVVDTVERLLLTPLGLRSLTPTDSRYQPRYEGGPSERDGAYHQGIVWPWLAGGFVEAWLRVNGDTASNRALARTRYLQPLLAHLDQAGLGHISEITDAEAPFTPRGCPFQAWSVAEAIRIDRMTAPAATAPRTKAPRARSQR